MTNLRLAYVHRFTDRHGHVRHYFRRLGSPRVTLPGLPGSAEFMAAYAAALAGKRVPLGGDRAEAGTFNALQQLRLRPTRQGHNGNLQECD